MNAASKDSLPNMKPSISGELRRSYQSNSTTGPPYKILVANATLEETL